MSTVTPVTVIQGLATMTFRGLPAPPYDGASFSFAHGQAERAYPYIRGKGHEHTGLDAEELPFTLYFLNTVGGPGMFPELWERWWAALQDGSPGPLVHPLLGPRDVVVRGGDVQLTSKVTSGVIVNVTFSTTLLDPEQEQALQSLQVNVTALAARADAAATNAEIPYPSGEMEYTLLDAVKQLDGALFSLEMTALGVISAVQSTINTMVAFVDGSTTSHACIESRDALVDLWAGLEDIATKVGAKARPTGVVLLGKDTTLDQFARDQGNTVADVVGLNPAALISPTVGKGTMLRYYT